MEYNELVPIREQLERIEKKIDDKKSNHYLNINQAAKFTSLSATTLRRAVNKGQLKCSKRTGKLLFNKSEVDRWLNG